MINKIAIALIVVASIFSIPTFSQQYEKPCPPGTNVLTDGQTLNPNTSLLRAFRCVDPNGKVTLQPDSTGQVAGADSIIVSPSCNGGSPGNTGNCYFAYFDARTTQDCSVTNGQPTITSATANFTSADLSKFAECITTGAEGSASIKGFVISVQSPTQITVSNNATANGSSLNFVIGHDDGPNLNAARTAQMNSGNGTLTGLSLPCGMTLVDSSEPLFPSIGGTTQNDSLSGCSSGGGIPLTTIILGADFIPATGCGTHTCVFETQVTVQPPIFTLGSNATFSNIRLTSLGFAYVLTSGNCVFVASPQVDNIEIIHLNAFIGSGSTCIGIQDSAGEARFSRLNLQANDLQEVDLTGQGDNAVTSSVIAFNTGHFNTSYAIFCNPSTQNICELTNNFLIGNGMPNNKPAIEVSTNSVTNIIGGTYSPGTSTVNLDVPVGATVNLAETQMIGATSIANITNAGKIQAHGTILTGTSALLDVTGAGTFYDLGSNTITGVTGNTIISGTSSMANTLNVASRNTTLSSQTLVPTTTGGPLGVTLLAWDSAAGTSCTGNTTVVWSVSYVNLTGNVETQSATETITTNGGATGGDPFRANFVIPSNASTNVTVSALYTIGTGCATGPSFAAQARSY